MRTGYLAALNFMYAVIGLVAIIISIPALLSGQVAYGLILLLIGALEVVTHWFSGVVISKV